MQLAKPIMQLALTKIYSSLRLIIKLSKALSNSLGIYVLYFHVIMKHFLGIL